MVENSDIIQKILDVDRELDRRRGNDALSDYNTGDKVHRKQLAFHRCQKRNRWVFGGNRSGKTECGAVEAVWLARGIHPYRPNRKDVFGWVVSLSMQVQRDVAQSKILHYLNPAWIQDIMMQSGRKDNPAGGIIDQIRVRNVFGGISVIGFKSCDQGREKFQGSSLDFVWFDEEPPKDVYEECRMRLLDRQGDLFGTMTPLKGLTFLYEEIYCNRRQDPEVWCESMEWKDNPFLPAAEIERMTLALDESALQSRRYGRFSTGEGLVYPEFDEQVHVIDPFPVPVEWQDTLSIDPGLNNPLSAHWYAVDYDDNVYVVAEHFAAGKDIDYHAAELKRISKAINWHTDRQGRIQSLIDSAATQRTLASQKSVADLFYERGILVNVHVNKDLFAGIARVKSYLRQDNHLPNLYIFSSCTNLIRELKGYFWGKGDSPVKRDDHALDELRYYLMSRPANTPPVHQTEVQRDKERKARRLQWQGHAT